MPDRPTMDQPTDGHEGLWGRYTSNPIIGKPCYLERRGHRQTQIRLHYLCKRFQATIHAEFHAQIIHRGKNRRQCNTVRIRTT